MANVFEFCRGSGVIIVIGMGNEELCRVECSKVDPREITPFK